MNSSNVRLDDTQTREHKFIEFEDLRPDPHPPSPSKSAVPQPTEETSIHEQDQIDFSNPTVQHTAVFALIVLMLIPVSLWIFCDGFRDFFYDLWIGFAALKVTGTNVLIFWGIGFLLTVATFATGFYEMIIGFILNSYFSALLMIISARFFGDLCIYWISKSCLYERLYNKLEHNELFPVLKYLAKTRPLKTLFLIRFAFIPKIIKNYGTPILGYKLGQFMSITILSDVFYASVAISFGLCARNFEDLRSGNLSNGPDWLQYVPMSIVGIGVLMIIILFIQSKKMINKVKLKYSLEQIKQRLDQSFSSTGTMESV